MLGNFRQFVIWAVAHNISRWVGGREKKGTTPKRGPSQWSIRMKYVYIFCPLLLSHCTQLTSLCWPTWSHEQDTNFDNGSPAATTNVKFSAALDSDGLHHWNWDMFCLLLANNTAQGGSSIISFAVCALQNAPSSCRHLAFHLDLGIRKGVV